jgi:hypothetical protein
MGIEMKNSEIASDHRLQPGAAKPYAEPEVGKSGNPESANPIALLDRVPARDPARGALKQVRQNKGVPGSTDRPAKNCPAIKQHWLEIRAQLAAGRYRPEPVGRMEIPKADGKTRPLGIPTVVDRFIQQALVQVVSAQWEPHFHPHSYGAMRPSLGLTLRANLRLFKIAPGDVVVLNAQRIRRCAKFRGKFVAAIAGWWTWTWKPSSTALTTTG